MRTARLELVPVTLPMVEAVLAGDRAAAEAVVGAALPETWPGDALIARAFHPSLDAIRADPARRLWGDSLLLPLDDGGPRRVIGSVIFHGRPDEDGVAEVGYGVEESSQSKGFATEGTRACVEWALAQPEVRSVIATTFPWHAASRRVIEKLGMQQIGTREHEVFGELWVFQLER